MRHLGTFYNFVRKTHLLEVCIGLFVIHHLDAFTSPTLGCPLWPFNLVAMEFSWNFTLSDLAYASLKQSFGKFNQAVVFFQGVQFLSFHVLVHFSHATKSMRSRWHFQPLDSIHCLIVATPCPLWPFNSSWHGASLSFHLSALALYLFATELWYINQSYWSTSSRTQVLSFNLIYYYLASELMWSLFWFTASLHWHSAFIHFDRSTQLKRSSLVTSHFWILLHASLMQRFGIILPFRYAEKKKSWFIKFGTLLLGNRVGEEIRAFSPLWFSTLPINAALW